MLRLIICIAAIFLATVAAAPGLAKGHYESSLVSVNVSSSGEPVLTPKPRMDAVYGAFLKENLIPLKHQHLYDVRLTSGGSVCSAISGYYPSAYCKCADSSSGGTVSCSYPVTISGSVIDTIDMSVGINVCKDPAELTFHIADEDTGITFDYEIDGDMAGTVPTGIMIGVPEIGNVEIVLTYDVSGSIDQLDVVLGLDLQATVVGLTTSCSSIYPSECPVIFFDETVAFGDFC